MSKPWFVEGVKPKEPTALSKAIAEGLEKTKPSQVKLVNGDAKHHVGAESVVSGVPLSA